MRGQVAWVAVVALAMAGCFGGSDTGTDSGAAGGNTPIEAADSTGVVEGLVVDDSYAPIKAAQVVVGNATTTTDDGGRFAIGDLPPGSSQIQVLAPGYEAVFQSVDIQAGKVIDLTFTLTKVAILTPYHDVFPKDGMLGCAGGGIHVCSALRETPLSDLGHGVVEILDITANVSAVKGIVFETAWEPASAAAAELDVDWWTYAQANPSGQTGYDAEIRNMTSARGPSPLKAVFGEGPLQAMVNTAPYLQYCSPNGPCSVTAYTNPAGDPTAVYFQQRFTHYVSVFYVDPPKADYTVLDTTG